eukprot:TRINITY_DN3325_c0_g1_i1.p1 TRINITY_DN3325_c0_g1~~TRINITY_DN3325_c0_g1_i1.p1  ORF type:complete len:285 (+),score=40.16 TRINITY_DN3325_c0_g1_i1:55-855(+)
MRGFEISFPVTILENSKGQNFQYDYRVMPQNEPLQQCRNPKQCDSTRNKEAKRLHGLPTATSSFIVDRVYLRDANVIMVARMSCKLKNHKGDYFRLNIVYPTESGPRTIWIVDLYTRQMSEGNKHAKERRKRMQETESESSQPTKIPRTSEETRSALLKQYTNPNKPLNFISSYPSLKTSQPKKPAYQFHFTTPQTAKNSSVSISNLISNEEPKFDWISKTSSLFQSMSETKAREYNYEEKPRLNRVEDRAMLEGASILASLSFRI